MIKQAEAAKITQYDSVCCQSNIEFKPFVLSTFGKLGSEAAALFEDLVKLQPESQLDTDDKASQYQQQLQLALKREIARMLLQGQSAALELPTDILELQSEDFETPSEVEE